MIERVAFVTSPHPYHFFLHTPTLGPNSSFDMHACINKYDQSLRVMGYVLLYVVSFLS